MTTTDLVLLGLVGLAVAVLWWCIYHAGKSNQRVREAQEQLKKAVEVEEANRELEEQSNDARDRAIDAGATAGPAPADPVSLPDEVRARIFGRRG